ncbi:MAG: MMPL family transporter [Candidatus Saccharimonadales bacterium]
MNLGKQLHKLGAFAFEHPWRILLSWLVVLGLLGFAALHFIKPPSSAISIPGTQAQAAIDRVSALFPKDGGGTGRIVFHANSGTIQDAKKEIDDLVAKVNKVDGVSLAVSPFADAAFVSDDKTIAYSQVQLNQQGGSVSAKTLSDVGALVKDTTSSSLQVEMGGDLVSAAPGEILGVGEIAGVVVALVVLVMTLGSLVSGGMPIVSALLSIGVSMAGLFALSQVFQINSTTPVLAVMLGLAVGIDYALFIVSKYRTLAKAGYSYKDAASRALGTAGNAVIFAAFTVVIALAALSIVNIPFMTIMGLAGAGSIAVAAIMSITLIPALLGFAGSRVFRKKQRAVVEKAQLAGPKIIDSAKHQSFWYRWGKAVTSRPIPVLLLTIIIIGVIALPARNLVLGLPTDQYAASSTTNRKAYDLLSQGFGVGFNGPLVVVVEGLPTVSDADKATVRDAAMKQYEQQVADATKKSTAEFQAKMAAATTPQQMLALQQAAVKAQTEGEAQKQAALIEIEKNVTTYAKYVQLNKVAGKLSSLENVKKTQPALVTEDGSAGIIQVIPKTAPSDEKTKALIVTLRDSGTVRNVTGSDNVRFGVTGSAALQEDINEKLSNALPVYLMVIVGLSLVLLIIAFRSILVPLKATLGFVLSVLAMFGATVAVFQWGWFGITDAAGPIVSFVPIIATGILFGLAMDYEFFLVSGMHEAYQHGKSPKDAVLEGFGAGSKVVTAAAVIMISVFAGFITNHQAVIQSIGFGLAVGIVVDAFLVRMTIVPAVMTLLGKHAWWIPKWLDKRLPHVSIEGEEQ